MKESVTYVFCLSGKSEVRGDPRLRFPFLGRRERTVVSERGPLVSYVLQPSGSSVAFTVQRCRRLLICIIGSFLGKTYLHNTHLNNRGLQFSSLGCQAITAASNAPAFCSGHGTCTRGNQCELKLALTSGSSPRNDELMNIVIFVKERPSEILFKISVTHVVLHC